MMEAPLHTVDPTHWLVYGDYLEEQGRMRSAVKARDITRALRWKHKLALISCQGRAYLRKAGIAKKYYVYKEAGELGDWPVVGWFDIAEMGEWTGSGTQEFCKRNSHYTPQHFPWLGRLMVWKFFFSLMKLDKAETKRVYETMG